MNDHQRTTAQACLDGAEHNVRTFPQIVGTLIEAGFESYVIDFRRARATYYLPDGQSLDLETHRITTPIATA